MDFVDAPVTGELMEIPLPATDPEDRGARGLRAEWFTEHGDPSRPDPPAPTTAPSPHSV